MSFSMTITIDDGDVEETFKVPAIWQICDGCEGCGTDRGRSVECDGGGFTASEWAEACDDDPDCDGEPGFAKKYFGGFYDRPCEYCEGKGRVLAIDRDLADADVLARYDTMMEDKAEYAAICAAERRMGA